MLLLRDHNILRLIDIKHHGYIEIGMNHPLYWPLPATTLRELSQASQVILQILP